MSNADYVREQLAEARKEKGRIAQIVRTVEIDRRTLDKFKDAGYAPHAATTDRLAAYFRREARKAEKA